MDHRNAMDPKQLWTNPNCLEVNKPMDQLVKIQEQLLLTGQIKHPNTMDPNLTTENNDVQWLNE